MRSRADPLLAGAITQRATTEIEAVSRDDLAYMLQNHGIALKAFDALTLLERGDLLSPEVMSGIEAVRTLNSRTKKALT